jgi:thioredoxin reductase (NADPH)
MSESSTVRNIVIVGSGPAGYTAAIYAARANLNPLLIAGAQPGGQLMITTDVENYPGFPEGVTGPEMMDLFRRQAERFGTDIQYETVTGISIKNNIFTVQAAENAYYARSVIVATGASARWLGLDSEKEFSGFGVSACATCDGFFFRGKTVAVVGGGDTALEEASYLTHHCALVYVIHRRDEFRASKIMQDRVLANPKIEVVWNSTVDEVLGQREPIKKVTGVRLRDTQSGLLSELDLDGVFIAIGHSPNSEIFKGFLDRDELGYLRTVPGSTKTNVPGVFVAGDVGDSVYRQAISAAGTGCMAAIDAERWLLTQG